MTVVLLHGAFRGGWSFAPVQARLAANGIASFAPDLVGAGRRWRVGHPPVGLADVLDDLEAWFTKRSLRDVVLVGHSQGGFVAQALTERIADRLAVVGFLDAPVPTDGERAVDLGGGGQAPPRDLWVPASPLDAATLGVSRLHASRWTSQLTPLSAAIAGDPVTLVDPAALAVARVYAWCSGTPEGFPSWHTRHQRQLAGHEDQVLDSPHDAPLARPDLVASWIQNLE